MLALITTILTVVLTALRSYPLWAEQAASQKQTDAEINQQTKDAAVRDQLDRMEHDPA